ncbi:hypothetical protein LUD23_29795, partial [Klebsiella pneumoniae]|uniref:hypothetical protein n=1 Tax=Klebsiella pneumoniae TaxID=573 RepID=UPI001E63017C
DVTDDAIDRYALKLEPGEFNVNSLLEGTSVPPEFGDKSIETDHNPLVWLKMNAGNNPRLLRWSLAIQHQNVTIQHRKEKRLKRKRRYFQQNVRKRAPNCV